MRHVVLVRTGLLIALALICAPPVAQARALTAQEIDAQLALARQDLDLGRTVAASKRWLAIAQASDDEAVLEDMTRALYEQHQLSAALTAAQRWLALNATSQQAHETAGLAAIRLFKPEAAYAHFQALIGSAYITPAAGFVALSGKVDANDSAAAKRVFRRLIAEFPNVAEAHYVVAKLAQTLEDLTLMQQEAAAAQQLAPYWSPAGLLLAKAQLLNGQIDVGLATAQEVVKHDDSIATRTEYASLLLLANRVNEAVTLWRELEALPDGDPSPAIRALAQIDVEVGNYQSAFNRFNRLLNTGRGISESMFYLGTIAERTGANDEARQLYDRVQEGEFASAAQLRVAKLIHDSEGLPAAMTFLKSYADANPEQAVVVYKARAELLSEAGDDAAALKLLDEANARYPEVASLRMARAYQLLRMKKTGAGVSAMRALLKERPDDATVLNALGYTLVDHDRDLQEGRNYIAKALVESPDSGPVLDSMGWALFKLGQHEAALDYLQRAAKRMSDPDIDLHLGEVLWSLGRRDEARARWQAGSQRFPDNAALKTRLAQADGQSAVKAR